MLAQRVFLKLLNESDFGYRLKSNVNPIRSRQLGIFGAKLCKQCKTDISVIGKQTLNNVIFTFMCT